MVANLMRRGDDPEVEAQAVAAVASGRYLGMILNLRWSRESVAQLPRPLEVPVMVDDLRSPNLEGAVVLRLREPSSQ